MYSTSGLHVHCVYKLIRLGHLTPHDYTRSHDTIQHIQKRDRTSREYLLLMQRLTRHVSVIRTTNSRRGGYRGVSGETMVYGLFTGGHFTGGLKKVKVAHTRLPSIGFRS